MNKNYIEVEHTYVDKDLAENFDIWYAVRPSPSRVRFSGDGEPTEFFGSSWEIEGLGPVLIHGREDIAGLRKLLDAIEEQMLLEVG